MNWYEQGAGTGLRGIDFTSLQTSPDAQSNATPMPAYSRSGELQGLTGDERLMDLFLQVRKLYSGGDDQGQEGSSGGSGSDPSSQMDILDSLQSGSIAGGNGIGGGGASPSFMGEGAGFSGPESIQGFSTGGILGGGGGTTAGTAASEGVMPVAGGMTNVVGGGAATGGTATAGGAGSGAASGLGSMGPIGAMIAAIIGGKAAQRKAGSNTLGRGLHGMVMPSFSQYKKDWDKGNYWGTAGSVIGVPFINAFTSSDEAVEEDPEWWPLMEQFSG